MKRILSIVLILVLLLSNFSMAEETTDFTDVSTEHWAYNAIKTMVNRGIISGYNDGTFRPNEPISRAEFATVMVLALGLEPNYNATSSFVDLQDDHWVLPYVDVAKKYLTGYTAGSGIYFKPDESAVREDMAVAIVRAKGFDVSSSDEGYLNGYSDKNTVSNGFEKYVGSAIKNGVMVGSEKDGIKTFNPSDVLTRAEASALLLNIIENEEKIVLDDDEIKLTVKQTDSGLQLNWLVASNESIEGYKVVASKNNPTPKYPDDGYIKYLNSEYRSYKLSGDVYLNNGDVEKLVPGESYYFTITGVTSGDNITSNTVHMIYPELSTQEITLKGLVKDNSLYLEWSTGNFDGYKVVASKSDSTPIYPTNGYYKYISSNHIEIPLGAYYKNGDFEKFESGEKYYFSITGLSGDKKVPSNTIALQFNETETPTVKLVGSSNGEQVILEWTDNNDSNISGYKVVASKSDGTPMYPENGYYRYIVKGSEQRVVINPYDHYNGGDVGEFKPGEKYYFAITALYGDMKVSSNVIPLTFSGEAQPEVTPEVTLSGVVSGNKFILEWNSYNDENVDGFKVVASKSDSTPAYPENGYYQYITVGNEERSIIEIGSSYHSGDIGTFEAGVGYYFTITTLYDGKKVNSNTIYLKINQ